MYTEHMEKRGLPQLLSRDKMLTILQEEEYGFLPQKPEKLSWEVEENMIKHFCAGKASFSRVTIKVTVNDKDFSFPITCAFPKSEGKHPFFIHINFRPDVPDLYMPTEELIDHGFAVLSFCYKDVTSDDANMSDGLAGLFYPDGIRGSSDAGKIAIWAWAAHRVMDYAQTLDNLDLDNATVCGHSRLGKTALFTAATDERFAFAHSNDSGCGGAAITRQKEGETVEDICKRFPYWFCENYQKYINHENEMPFDQHYLIAAIAPRCVNVASAEKDIWADPFSEMLSCIAASPIYETYGKKGFIYENREQKTGDVFHEGNIGYHLRGGEHYFSREDWLKLIDFINKHKN